MKKFFYFFSFYFFLICSAHAQLSPYSGYYGETGPDNQSFETNGNPIIFVFYNNDDCPSCPEALDLIEQAYNENFEGEYNFYIINYDSEEVLFSKGYQTKDGQIYFKLTDIKNLLTQQ